MSKIYVASSWRNSYQPAVVAQLRAFGHQVYDFRNPLEEYDNPVGVARGFSWDEIDPAWQSWDARKYIKALDNPIAQQGFDSDWMAMKWADVGIVVYPSGRSAHLEAGYFVGAGKPLYVYMPLMGEPELMYKMANGIFTSLADLTQTLTEASND